jgi:hypothetical protein
LAYREPQKDALANYINTRKLNEKEIKKMIQQTELQKFNVLLANYKPQTNKGFNFHRQKELTILIDALELQQKKAQREMEKAITPIKKEIQFIHKAYMKEAVKMGIVNPEPRKERTNSTGYRFAYYQHYLQALQFMGDNKRFTITEFRDAVKDGGSEATHKNRLLNMANDGHIKKLNAECTLFATPAINPERGISLILKEKSND